MKELVQQQRSELYAAGHQNLNMALPEELIAQIDELKRRHRLRSRDAVISRAIRKCMATTSPDAFTRRAIEPGAVYRRISPIVPAELVDYVKRVQLRFRNIAYGPVFEMIFAEIDGNVSHPGFQLELIRSGDP